MMNKHAVIVVEGRHDQAKINAIYPDAHIITTQGSALNQDTLELLKALNQIHTVIILTDPDAPGDKIRHAINQYIGETDHVFLRTKDCINKTGKKVGVEHASPQVIKQALGQILHSDVSRETITRKDFNALGLNGCVHAKLKRETVSEYFNIGKCNAKTMYKRLNLFGISIDALRRVIV